MTDSGNGATVQQGLSVQEQTTADALPPLSAARKIGWGIGALTDVIVSNAYGYLALRLYTDGLHMPLKVLTTVAMLMCILDMAVSMSVASISDNIRTRWGRRMPFIFIGTLLCSGLFIFLWGPPRGLSPFWACVYFIALYIPYQIAYAIFTVPWGAMGLELSPDLRDRSSVQTYKTIIQTIGGIAVGGLWWMAFWCGNGDRIAGMRWVSLLVAALICIAGVVSALNSHERTQTKTYQKVPFLQAITSTFRNHQFMLVIGFVFLVLVGLFLIQPMAFMINVHYVFHGNRELEAKLGFYMNLIFQLVGAALAPGANWLCHRIGKKKTLYVGLSLVATGYLLSWWTYTPNMPYLQMITLGLCSPGLSCMWIVAPAMIADLCELDEKRTGERKEGMYYAVYSWAIKIAIVGSSWLSAFMAAGAGYSEEIQLLGSNVVFNLRLMYMIVPAVFAVLAIFVVAAYPLTENRMQQLREELAA